MLKHNGKYVRPINKKWNEHGLWKHPIKSATKGKMWINLAIGIIWCVATLSMNKDLFAEGPPSFDFNTIVSICLAFGGPYFLWRTYISWRDWQSFGYCPLHLTTYPALHGEKLEGEIRFSQRLESSVATMTLSCVRTEPRGEHSQGKKTTLFSKDFKASVTHDANQSYLPIELDLPKEQPESGENYREKISWSLAIALKSQGSEFNREYLLPVYKGRIFESSI